METHHFCNTLNQVKVHVKLTPLIQRRRGIHLQFLCMNSLCVVLLSILYSSLFTVMVERIHQYNRKYIRKKKDILINLTNTFYA